MSPSIRIADALSRREGFDPHQAVAIVLALSEQFLMADGGDSTSTGTPLTAEHVHLSADGTVRCDAAGSRTVAEAGRLLNSLLPQRGPVPGALRYTVARAQEEVDAPPFGSLEAFAAALKRFEKGSRRDVLSALYAEATALAASGLSNAAPVPPPTDELRLTTHDHRPATHDQRLTTND